MLIKLNCISLEHYLKYIHKIVFVFILGTILILLLISDSFSGMSWAESKVEKGEIWEAKPRKKWLCKICKKTIYPGEIAYYLGDYRDGRRTYICSECVYEIQAKK